MKKDLVASGTNESESIPLLTPRGTVQVLVKEGDEISSLKKTSLSNLASEESGRSLENSIQATTKPVDEPTVHKQETTESPALEGGDTSTGAVEDMSVNQILDPVDEVMDDPVGEVIDDPVDEVMDAPADQVMDDTPAPPGNTPESSVYSPLEEEPLTESPEESEPENRRCRLLDPTMYLLILEVILLVFPISMAYYSIAYFQDCPGGYKLPMLLLVLAVLSALTLFGRIMISIGRTFKISYGVDIPQMKMVIFAGEFLVFIVFVAEFAYIFTMKSVLCNKDFYEYVFYMNNVFALFMSILLFHNAKKTWSSYQNLARMST